MNTIIKYKTREEFYTSEKCFIIELLNSDNYPAFSIAQARVAPGITTEIHTLRSTDEVYFILSGRGEMEIGGIVCGIMEEKDTVFIPRDLSQRIRNISDQDLIFLCICAPRFEVKNYE